MLAGYQRCASAAYAGEANVGLPSDDDRYYCAQVTNQPPDSQAESVCRQYLLLPNILLSIINVPSSILPHSLYHVLLKLNWRRLRLVWGIHCGTRLWLFVQSNLQIERKSEYSIFGFCGYDRLKLSRLWIYIWIHE